LGKSFLCVVFRFAVQDTFSSIPAKAGTHSDGKRDVLRLHARQQALWNPLYRNDIRSCAADLGAQEQGRALLHQANGVDPLVWFEAHQSRDTALQREKQIKEWKQNWKINLIERENRHWNDLSRP
jgi:hypothetical protein